MLCLMEIMFNSSNICEVRISNFLQWSQLTPLLIANFVTDTLSKIICHTLAISRIFDTRHRLRKISLLPTTMMMMIPSIDSKE